MSMVTSGIQNKNLDPQHSPQDSGATHGFLLEKRSPIWTRIFWK